MGQPMNHIKQARLVMVCRMVFIRLVFLGVAAVAANSGQTATPAAAEIQPLLTTQWGQRDLYAKYVPNGERLGCWSVALAQILYYHRVQPAGQVSYDGSGYRVRESLDHRFDWDLFADTVTEATPARTQNEVAKYCYYAAIVIGKDFAGEAAYHGNSDARRKGVSDHFSCTTRRYRTDVEGWEAVGQVILSELAERRPLLLYADPHAFVIDGARGDAARFEVHLNCGWGGADNGWYRFNQPFKTSRGLLGGTSRWVMTIQPPDQPKARPANAPSTSPSAADMRDLRKWRTWTTADGRFRVHAKFVRSSSDTVTLEKQDGTTVDVRLEILCAEDRDFVGKHRLTSSPDEP